MFVAALVWKIASAQNRVSLLLAAGKPSLALRFLQDSASNVVRGCWMLFPDVAELYLVWNSVQHSIPQTNSANCLKLKFPCYVRHFNTHTSGIYDAGKPFRGKMIGHKDEPTDLHLPPATKVHKIG
jgi:hypothetical protein